VLAGAISEADVLTLTGGAGGRTLVLFGPRAPEQGPPPRSVVETQSCAAVAAGSG